MTQIAIRTEDKIILWNYKDDTDQVYPAGQVVRNATKLIRL